MKRLLALLLLCAGPVLADGVAMMKTSTPPSVDKASIVCNGTDANNYTLFSSSTTSLIYPIENATQVDVHIFSDAGSTATVLLQSAVASGGPWFTVATITNPGTTGELWSVARANYLRLNVSPYTSGNVRGCLSAWRDEKKIW